MNDHYYTEKSTSKSEPKTFKINFRNQNYIFKTDNGVFSKNYLDFGTQVLLENFDYKNGEILDLGCGYGVVGVILGKILPQAKITMTDINERALELAKENALNNNIEARVIKSNAAEGLAEQFDTILTNPPIRAGKDVVFNFYLNSYKLLRNSGELWVVIQKKQGAASSKKFLEGKYASVDIITVKKGYVVLKCVK